MHKQLDKQIPTPLLTQPNLPTHLGQPNSPIQFFTGSEHAHSTSYKAQFFSYPSDLKKSTVKDESLYSTTSVLFQRRIYLLNDTTE